MCIDNQAYKYKLKRLTDVNKITTAIYILSRDNFEK